MVVKGDPTVLQRGLRGSSFFWFQLFFFTSLPNQRFKKYETTTDLWVIIEAGSLLYIYYMFFFTEDFALK